MQEKHPPPTFEIQNQNKGIEDRLILDIDSHYPYLLFGETTSHLTSIYVKGQYFTFFNVENSIKREMKKMFGRHPPPPPEFFSPTPFFF